MTLEELRKLREEQKTSINKRDTSGKNIEVIIGMGTCGIAAGAKESLDKFIEEVETAGLTDVLIRQTGCMGLCHAEPTVEIKVPGMPEIVYGNVKKDIVPKIVKDHLVGKKLLDDLIFDKPSADLMKGGDK